MDKAALEFMLQQVADHKLSPDMVLTKIMEKSLNLAPQDGDPTAELKQNFSGGYNELGFAKVDTDRERRNGFPEVIFGQGKTAEQIIAISRVLEAKGSNLLTTRIDGVKAEAVQTALPEYVYDAAAECLCFKQHEPPFLGKVAVVTAGTADHKVAEEAAVVGDFLGLKISRIYDVGVAGIHRLLDKVNLINDHEVVICVAGMEGALVSVLGGLIDKPLLAVPSGIGYGIGADGITTLMAMLNSCASGVAVLNIGNGFGSAYMAATICRQIRIAERKIKEK